MLETWWRNTKTLEEEILAMTIFDQGQTQNGNLWDHSTEDDADNQWQITNQAYLFVSAVLSITKANNDHPQTLQERLEAQNLDPDCRQILKIVDERQSNFRLDTNGFLVRMALLDRAIQIYIPAAYHPAVRHLHHYTTLAGHRRERHMYDTMRTQ